MSNVRVICRLRPMTEREKKAGTVPAASASTERKEVAVQRKTANGRQTRMTFKFDEVLSSYSSQEEVFNSTLQPLVGQVLAGYEATAFAYGQTGTGKTYTMEGITGSEEGRGLMPRAAATVLDALSRGDYSETRVSMSCLEIYNEELSDLLAPAQCQPKLDLLDSHRGVCCVGLSEVPVTTLEDILRLVGAAQERRRVAETRINARSSRSHCIFTMKVLCRRSCSGGEQESVGKLHLVDLAGSECAKKAQPAPGEGERSVACAPEQERERRNINQSLLTLRRVITALREKSGRIPYRDSKLTRLLKDALGGSCRTVLIATISPALAVVDETISTLTYAEQAAGIQNRPVASSMLRMASGSIVCDHNSEFTLGAEGCSDLEMKVAYLSQEVEECQGALARKQQEVLELTERAECAEEELQERDVELERMREELARSHAAQERMATAAAALAGELASITGSLATSRGEVLAKAEKLGTEDAAIAEGEVSALLQAQKQALHVEVAEVRATLEGAHAELHAAHGEIQELREGQVRSRSAALEAIMSLARRELSSMGEQIDSEVMGVSTHLEKAGTLAEDASASTASAQANAVARVADVAAKTEQWTQDIASGCSAISKASSEAMEVAERGVGAVSAQLRSLGEVAEAAAHEEREHTAVAIEKAARLAEDWDSTTAKENVDVESIVITPLTKPVASLPQKTKSGKPRLLREVNC